MALKKGLVSGSANHEDEGGNRGSGGYMFVLAVIVLLAVFALLRFVVLGGFHTTGAFLYQLFYLPV